MHTDQRIILKSYILFVFIMQYVFNVYQNILDYLFDRIGWYQWSICQLEIVILVVVWKDLQTENILPLFYVTRKSLMTCNRVRV